MRDTGKRAPRVAVDESFAPSRRRARRASTTSGGTPCHDEETRAGGTHGRGAHAGLRGYSRSAPLVTIPARLPEAVASLHRRQRARRGAAAARRWRSLRHARLHVTCSSMFEGGGSATCLALTQLGGTSTTAWETTRSLPRVRTAVRPWLMSRPPAASPPSRPRRRPRAPAAGRDARPSRVALLARRRRLSPTRREALRAPPRSRTETGIRAEEGRSELTAPQKAHGLDEECRTTTPVLSQRLACRRRRATYRSTGRRPRCARGPGRRRKSGRGAREAGVGVDDATGGRLAVASPGERIVRVGPRRAGGRGLDAGQGRLASKVLKETVPRALQLPFCE